MSNAALDRSHFTHYRNEANANGEDVVVELHITTLDRHNSGETCTLCPSPAALLVEVWQSYRRDGYDLRDLTDAYDPLCAGCAEHHAPGLLDFTRRWEDIQRDIRAIHRANEIASGASISPEQHAAGNEVISAMQAAAAPLLAVLGFDPETAAQAVDGITTSIIIATAMTGYRTVGPDVPGGEIWFMPDNADPDGPLGDVSGGNTH